MTSSPTNFGLDRINFAEIFCQQKHREMDSQLHLARLFFFILVNFYLQTAYLNNWLYLPNLSTRTLSFWCCLILFYTKLGNIKIYRKKQQCDRDEMASSKSQTTLLKTKWGFSSKLLSPCSWSTIGAIQLVTLHWHQRDEHGMYVSSNPSLDNDRRKFEISVVKRTVVCG